jgi:Flp pilus assembly protein TadG/uncharacterized protein YegL
LGLQACGKALAARMRSLANDRSGAFAMMFAFSSVPILIALGCSFDYVQAVNTQRRMQSALDAALVASVKNIGSKDTDALKTQIANWIAAESSPRDAYILNTNGVVIDTSTSTIKASVSATVPTTFLKIAGINSMPVAVSSAVIGGPDSISKNAFSMYLVLDRSGSMSENTNTSYTTTCYSFPLLRLGAYTCTKKYTKIEALKLAVSSLMGQLATADPEEKYVRTGAVSYNAKMQTPSPLAWGESAALSYVNLLTATSQTNSSTAMAEAYDSLTEDDAEDKAHEAKNGDKDPEKFIVLMTDGANTKSSYDDSTKATCDLARNNGVQVFTIAFMAPTQGQELLRYCASTSDDYFPAENTADLVAAFKLIGETSSKTIVRLTQ